MKIYLYINKIKNLFLNLLFPNNCIGCNIKNEIFCFDCTKKINQSERKIDGNIMAVFNYKDTIIKKAIWELKYHNKRYLGEKLGELIYEYLIEDISEIKMVVSGRSIFVIPTPISKRKGKLRGYNQASMIARGFCNKGGINNFELKDNIIYKKIDTLPQAKITNRKRRLENVRGVFEIKDEKIIKGRTVILIDDVVTTGGTMMEMMKILKKAGAKKVYGFALAH
jgi:competence protein ComFC